MIFNRGETVCSYCSGRIMAAPLTRTGLRGGGRGRGGRGEGTYHGCATHVVLLR